MRGACSTSEDKRVFNDLKVCGMAKTVKDAYSEILRLRNEFYQKWQEAPQYDENRGAYRAKYEAFDKALELLTPSIVEPTAPMDGIGKRMKVITLCGSTRFKDQFLEQQKRLTLEGNIVISVGLFGHSGDEEVWKPGMKEMLDKMHLQKIDMADEIFVINVGGYIGESTRREITYSEKTGKTVRYLE